MAIFDQLISPLLTSAQALISEFHLSPEDKVKAEQWTADQAQVAQKQANDYEIQLNTIAGQNIRADAASGDKFTQRARPWFMYIIEFILAFNYIAVPAYEMVTGKALVPVALPADLLTLFGVCVTGYVFNRTAEKIAAMPGDSSVNMLGIIRASNKPTQ
jgi:hypothetical protein